MSSWSGDIFQNACRTDSASRTRLWARQRQILLLGETVMKAVDEEADDEEGESEEEENESDEESALEAELLTEDDQSEEDRSTEGLDEGPEKLGLNGENPIDAIVF